MKEKFKYRIRHFRAMLFANCFIYFALTLLSLAMFANVTYAEAAIAVWISATVGMIAIYALSDNLPSKFSADRDSVEFKLLFKKTNIRYSSIKSIEVTHKYAKPQTRGDAGGYKEIIKFVCGDGEYQFENIMKIDFEQTAAAPESLSEQFERGKFMRLKNYISRQTGITY